MNKIAIFLTATIIITYVLDDFNRKSYKFLQCKQFLLIKILYINTGNLGFIMGKYDLTINLAKRCANFVKASGKRCLLETKPITFSGINPTITYPGTGKTFALPRFISTEMKQARQMNRIASQQLRTPISREFPKATSDDLIRLTDTSYEASNLRAIYTNPKDGKVYHLLSEGRTESGMARVRILDADGAFVRTAELKPKKIVILDSFTGQHRLGMTSSDQLINVSHGTQVELAARRTNPFANIEVIDIRRDGTRNGYLNLADELKILQRRIDAGENIDIVSLSIGQPISKNSLPELLGRINATELQMKTTNILNNNNVYARFPLGEFASRNKGKVRVIQSSGNWGKDKINADLCYPEIEGVGALGTSGKVSGISASRSSLYTQHYEQGIFPYKATPHGLSIFNGTSTDIPLRPEVRNLVTRYLGQKPVVASVEETRIINSLKMQCQRERSEFSRALRKELISPAEEKQLSVLWQKAKTARQTRTNVEDIRKYKEYENMLLGRLKPRMETYVAPSEAAYKESVQKLLADGKVIYGQFDVYYIPNTNPAINGNRAAFTLNRNTGLLELEKPVSDTGALVGTSFAAPMRSARIALNDMMEGIV